MRKDSILQNYYYSKLPKADEGLEYKGSSIVDYLATKGYSGKKAFRKELAEQYGIENYDFSAAKNLELLSKIKENEEILKKIQPSFAPVSVEKMMQMEKEAATPKAVTPRYTSLPNKRSEEDIKKEMELRFNMMMSSPFVPRGLPPINFGFKTKLKRDPIAFRSNVQPDRVPENKPQQLPQKSPLDWNGRNQKGTQLANFKSTPQVVAVDNGFRGPYIPPSESTQSLPFPLFPQFGSTSGSTSNTTVPSYPEIPPYIDILKDDYQEFKNAGKKIYNFGKEKAEDLYEFGKDKFNDAYDFGKQGLNYLERLYYKQMGDPVQISELPDIKPTISQKPKSDSTKIVQEPVIPDFIDKPVIEGTPAWDNNNVYHATNIVDLNKVNLGIRNRGDRNTVKSSGWLFGAVDDENNFKHVQNALTDKLDADQFYGGIDSKGKFELKKGKDFQNKDYKVLPFRVITNTEGLSRNKKGNYKTIDASKAAAGHISPVFEGDQGMGSAGLLINPYKKRAYDSYSKIDGGHIIVTTPDFKQKILLSGSVNEIDKQIKNFKKHYNVQKVNIVVPDNGAFSRTYMKKDGQMTSKDWEELDNRNEAGGLGFYLQGQGYEYGGLIQYGPGGATTDGCKPGFSKHPLTGQCVPNGWKSNQLGAITTQINQTPILYNQPTSADSLKLYNRALEIENYYKSKGYTQTPVFIDPEKQRATDKEFIEYLKKQKTQTEGEERAKQEHIKREKKILAERLQESIEYQKNQKEKKFPNYLKSLNKAKTQYDKTGPAWYKLKGKEYTNPMKGDRKEDNTRKLTKNEKYYNRINDNQFEQRELSFSFLDFDSPIPLYDKRIVPQNFVNYSSPDSNDAVEVFQYDPLAVKPTAMRTPEEQVQWEILYGDKSKKSTPTQQPVSTQEVVSTNTVAPVVAPVQKNQSVPKGDYIFGPANSVIGVVNNGVFTKVDMPEQRGGVNKADLDLLNNEEALRKYVQQKGLKYRKGGIVKAQDGLPFEGAIFNALHKKGDYPKERQAVINQLANLPIYPPDVRYASYQEALPIWRTNVENVPIEVNPNSPHPGSSYFGYGAPAFSNTFPYQGTVQLDPRDSDLINTGQRITQHELRHAAFDGRNFIPQWYGDALYNTARKPEGFETGAHQDRLNERASMTLGARQAIIDRFGLKSNAKIPKELFNRYNREILETSLRQGRPIEQFSDLDETLRGARNATDAYNIINFELPRRKKGGMIEDNAGQWAHPGKNTRIRSPHITMEGVPYPVLAKANNGMSTMMQPGQDYYFPGADYVDEFPKKKSKGGWLEKYS